ncbi:MAG: hypothetical protein ACKPKO_27060, partial [Candidatus Fonsibacter sp.]
MNATFRGDTPVKLLSFETLEETEKAAAAEASSYPWVPAAGSPSIAKETSVSGSPSKPLTSSQQEVVVRALQYGQTGTSSIRACVAKTILKLIKDRLKWRPYPKRKGDASDESGDLQS